MTGVIARFSPAASPPHSRRDWMCDATASRLTTSSEGGGHRHHAQGRSPRRPRVAGLAQKPLAIDGLEEMLGSSTPARHGPFKPNWAQIARPSEYKNYKLNKIMKQKY